jgi:hypothetical protein
MELIIPFLIVVLVIFLAFCITAIAVSPGDNRGKREAVKSLQGIATEAISKLKFW